ncbi:MAG: dolichyl-phosphate beta-glucosyltransferase [Candidatus Binatia bacterium]
MQSNHATPVTSVVSPCFNEERRIASTVERVLSFLRRRQGPWEVVVVDDGSADATTAVVRERFSGENRVRSVRFEENHGKGWAVREGVRAASGDLVLFTDADLSTPIEELPKFERRAAEGFDLVIASRVVEGARILTPQPFQRRLSGWVFRTLVRALGLSSFRDTQCGFKLMRRRELGPILEAMRTDGFAFDVELISRAEAAGLRVAEEPVDWSDSAGSKVRLYPDALRMARDLVRLRLRLGARRRR